ncbi:MAG: acyl-CoA synthetase (AMP-forming)/AMP-acid ligase II [Candidatus Aldehydirespiratoraceae bacterium]|uniref:long-chain-fatty-acid--CoA ligase n=1 Tax=uncultured Ilumatobacter sp. TaxID=879968 RepID=UPI00374E5643
MTYTLGNIVREFARSTPDAPALTFEGETLTFAQLNVRSSRVANALSAQGLVAGDRVAVLSKNAPEFFDLAMGCSKIGAILVGLNWRLAAPEIAVIVADAAPSMIVVGATERHLLASDDAEPASRIIVFGEEFDAWRDSASAHDPAHVGESDDVTLLLYTSGTTGLPKGVMLTNAGMSYTAQLGQAWKMSADSVNLVAMPLFHIGGIGYGTSTMALGGHTVVMREFDPIAVVDAIAKHGVTHSFFVPAAIQAMLAAPGVRAADLSSLELLSYGASPIGDALLREAIDVFGCDFTQAYGMTETSGTVVGLPAEDHDPDGDRAHLLRSCGRAFPWVELRVIDPTTLDDVPVGDVGEIWIRSGMVTAGYWNKPEATAEAIVDGGWLRTGDAAFQDDEGYIFLFDRFKDMIVSGGENIYPAEVENAMADHPDISEVAVIGVPDERWGETPKAIVVLRIGSAVTQQELVEFTQTRLAKYKCPTSIEFTDVLPRNASGKVLKKDLRQVYWHGRDRAVN